MPGTVLSERYDIAMDLPGETLIYTEPEPCRRATIICTFGRPPCLSPRTLSAWWHPMERKEEAMTGDEARLLIERIVEHCRSRFGMSDIRIEGEIE